MGEVTSSRTAATDMADALLRWRTWAQFVWLGGGPITQSDDDLRQAMCEQFDRERELVRTLRAFVQEIASEELCDDPVKHNECYQDSGPYCGTHDSFADYTVKQARALLEKV